MSPARPELSANGKTGSGIGRAITLSFAHAGASKIVLVGRTGAKLQETQKMLPAQCKSSIHPASVTDEAAITRLATEVGTWDSIQESAVDEWWQNQCKRLLHPNKGCPPTANPSCAAIIGLSSLITYPPATHPGLSGYITSKFALTRFIACIAAENPFVFAAALNPGMVYTALTDKLGADPDTLPLDEAEPPANFTVRLTSEEGSFLDGRYVFANWDDELKAKKGSDMYRTFHSAKKKG
ncbi:hypothetical protein BDW72DRAFT_201432 [Aspergillus terricola var. indicus]